MELKNENRPSSRPFGKSRHASGVPVRLGFWVLAVFAAFWVGNLLGAIHYGTSPLSIVSVALFSPSEQPVDSSGPDAIVIHESDLPQSERDPNVAGRLTENVSSKLTRRSPSGEQPNRKLRLRSVSRLSSASARAGERVTFVTEEAIEDACGRTVPAGAVVEGVISHAASSAEAGAGKLVIEIHSMQTGRRSLTLSALPLAAIAISSGDPVPAERSVDSALDPGARTARTPRRGGSGLLRRTIDNLNEAPAWVKGRMAGSASRQSIPRLLPDRAVGKSTRQTHEAVVPKETVLEFELITLPSGGPRTTPASESQGSPDSEPQPQRAPTWQQSVPRTSHG